MAPLQFGLLLLQPHQLLDAAGPIDMITMNTPAYLEACDAPQSLISKATAIDFHYISSTLSPVSVSAGPQQIPTCTYETCPKLDYLLIPGPPPYGWEMPDGLKEFIIAKTAEVKAMLAVCSGSLVLAWSGVLAGKRASCNKSALAGLVERGLVPKGVEWQKHGRWTVDGKFWTSSGVHSGMDMAAEFLKVVFDKEVAEWGFQAAEFMPRERDDDPFSAILDGLVL